MISARLARAYELAQVHSTTADRVEHPPAGAQHSHPMRATTSSSALASKRGVVDEHHAPAFQGAKKQLHACLAQPATILRCRSPGRSPIQIVDRWPTG